MDNAQQESSGSEKPVGALIDSTLQVMMAKIISEIILPEIRKIVAQELDAFNQNQRRYVVTMEPAP